jgi:hypothetical protein
VPSRALTGWQTQSASKLDQLIAAHARVGGTGPGRRYATDQINASLVVQVAAHFQLFCRDVHSDAADVLVAAAPRGYEQIVELAFTTRRGLDRGNPSPGTISADFERFDLDIWALGEALSTRTVLRRRRLEQLTAWRNAIAHQDFSFSARQQQLLSGTALTLAWAQRWRAACDGLARTFDKIMAAHVGAITGARPW